MYESRERADGNHGIPSSAPAWVRESMRLEHERRDLPASLRRRLRELDKMEGIAQPPWTPSKDAQRRERLLKAMAGG